MSAGPICRTSSAGVAETTSFSSDNLPYLPHFKCRYSRNHELTWITQGTNTKLYFLAYWNAWRKNITKNRRGGEQQQLWVCSTSSRMTRKAETARIIELRGATRCMRAVTMTLPGPHSTWIPAVRHLEMPLPCPLQHGSSKQYAMLMSLVINRQAGPVTRCVREITSLLKWLRHC